MFLTARGFVIGNGKHGRRPSLCFYIMFFLFSFYVTCYVAYVLQ